MKTLVGIDLGGTKLAMGALSSPQSPELSAYEEVSVEQLGGLPVTSVSQRELFLDSLANKISLFIKEQGNTVSTVGLGTPGKYVNGIMQAHTTPMLGKDFDNFNFQEALQQRLGTSILVKAFNDALAQMLFGMIQYRDEQTSESYWMGRQFFYLGIGTGIGGGAARWNSDSKVEFYTDGHIGDLVMESKDGKPLCLENDFLSGHYIEKALGRSAKELSISLEQGTASRQDKSFASQLGKNLARSIKLIHTGQISKVRDETKWSPKEVNEVKGTKCFLIGGSIGTKGELSRLILQEARQKIRDKNLESIELYQIPGDSAKSAVIGSALFSQYVVSSF